MQFRGFSPSITLLRLIVPKAAFTVDNATNIFTSNAHGFVDGDVVKLSNSSGALPAGSDNTTLYYVKTIDINTFYLYIDTSLKFILDVSDDGSGTNSFNLQCRAMNVQDYMNIQIDVDTKDSCAITLKCQGSNEDICPNFSGAQSTANIWKYINMVELSAETDIAGATGIVASGTDIHKSYEINTTGLSWVSFEVSGYSAGEAQLKAKGYSNI